MIYNITDSFFLKHRFIFNYTVISFDDFGFIDKISVRKGVYR